MSTRAAARYAKAMLEVSLEKGNIDVINNDMILISQSISQTKDLRDFLVNPIVKDQVKLNALLEVFASVNEGTKELFKLLCANSRFDLLLTISKEFQAQYDLYKGIENVTVTTAMPLDAVLEAKVLEKVNSIAPGKQAKITNVVDESILGGFILKVGDIQYNASLANQLQVLKRQLIN